MLKDSVAIARHGIYIQTPQISEQQATVSVQVEVEGIKNKKYDLTIAAVIYGPDGQQVAQTSIAAPQDNKQPTVEVLLPQVTVEKPQLWWCETPNLYTAEVSLVLNGKTVDCLRERFGIRTVEFSREYGFRLNGKKIFLQGMANHHDLGAVGAAAYERGIARMMDKIKEFGYNHIRTSHNPTTHSSATRWSPTHRPISSRPSSSPRSHRFTSVLPGKWTHYGGTTSWWARPVCRATGTVRLARNTPSIPIPTATRWSSSSTAKCDGLKTASKTIVTQ